MGIKRIENDAYEIKHLKVDVEVGDRKTPGFKPKLKMKRWDGECSLDIDFAEETTEEELEEELDSEGNIIKIKWKIKTATSELELEYYPLEPRIENYEGQDFLQCDEGGLEFAINLVKKPLVNTFQMPISTKGLVFYYQRELTQEEIDNGALRPPSVVGSYAVYHAIKSNIHKGKDAEKYKCGKAFHIYRPKIIDAESNETWGDLNIADGYLTITIDQNWLDNAVYPVLIDPIFGWNGIGGTSQNADDRITGSQFTCPEAGTGNSITTYWFNSNDANKHKNAIYLHSDLSLKGGTTEGGIGYSGSGWRTENFVVEPELTAVDYVLVGWADQLNPAGPSMKWDDGVGTTQGHYDEEVYGNFADVDPLVPTHEDRKYSIYCTYEEVAVPANPLIGKPLISPDIIKKAIIR